MSTAVVGSGTFLDLFAPAKGKSEWGMDTLTRRMSGARSLLDAFLLTLGQGLYYQGYYLQTWDIDDNPNVPIVSLNYKGLQTGGTPEPLQETEIVSAVGRTSKDYSDEGDPVGIGRLYRTDVIWSLTSPAEVPGDYGITGKGLRYRYAVSAIMEFTYKSPQTRYRYITVGRPYSARYSSTGVPTSPNIDDARITTSDGTVYGREKEVFFGLQPFVRQKVVSFTSREIVGTPWWECEDVVRAELGNAP